MGDSSMLTALPFGFVLVLGMYLAARLRRARRDAAVTRLPELAQRLGLEHRPAAVQGQPGSLRGLFEGHEIFVAVHEHPRVVVRFGEPPGLQLRSYLRQKHPPLGMQVVSLGTKKLDTFFKDRYATEAMAARLVDDDVLREALERFRFTWQLRLGDLAITDEGVECRPDYGKPPHIPVGEVEPLLGDLVELADLVSTAGPDAVSPDVE